MSPGDEVALDPQPIPPGRAWLVRGLSDLIASAFIEPDGPSGTADPHGPGGPVMRDLGVGLSLVQLASLLADDASKHEVQAIGIKIVQTAAQRLP